MKKQKIAFFLSFLLGISTLTACVKPAGGTEVSDNSSVVSNAESYEISDTESSEETSDAEIKDLNKVVLRFAAMSDIHLGGSASEAEYKRFKQSLDFMYEFAAEQSYKNFDLLLVAGDMTNHGYDNELAAFQNIVDEKLKEGTEKLFIMGNHEFYNDDTSDTAQQRWEAATGETKNSHKVVNGYHFIGVSPNSGYDFTYIKSWLDEQLQIAVADDPAKPVFVTQHHHIKGTVYGSADWGTDLITGILNKYPQVVNFSGHSHYPINDPRSIHQKNFTSLGCGTLSYFELEGGMVYGPYPPGSTNAAQFWVVEVYEDNSVGFKAYDLITKQFFPLEYKIPCPVSKDTFIYTDKRAENSQKPLFPEGAKLEVKDIKKSSATLVFDHAADDDLVHSYIYQFYTKDAKLAAEFKTFSDYYYLNRPESMSYTATGLKPGTEYLLKITAIDCYGKESDNTLEAEFKTDGEPPEPADPNAPLPDADFLDVVFGENGAADKGTLKKTVENFKNALIEKDDKLGGEYAAKFTGNGDYLRVKFSKSEYDTLTETISLSARFMINKINTSDYMDAVGNMQSGGYGFEITASGVLEFWISINGSYTTIETKVKEGVYYTVTGTYDGSKVILYVDGKKVGEKNLGGYITYPADSSAHALCIGADVQPGGTGTSFFNGNVAFVKIHSTALSEKQVKELAEQ